MVIENNSIINRNSINQPSNKFSNHNNGNTNLMENEDSELNRLIFQTNDRQRNRKNLEVDTWVLNRQDSYENVNADIKQVKNINNNLKCLRNNSNMKNTLDVPCSPEKLQANINIREPFYDALEETLQNETVYNKWGKSYNKDEGLEYQFDDDTAHFNNKTSNKNRVKSPGTNLGENANYIQQVNNHRPESNLPNFDSDTKASLDNKERRKSYRSRSISPAINLGDNANYIQNANKNRDQSNLRNIDSLASNKFTMAYTGEDVQEQTIDAQKYMMKQTQNKFRSNSKDALQSIENVNNLNQNYNRQDIFRNTAYKNMTSDNGSLNQGNTLKNFNKRRMGTKESLNDIILDIDTHKRLESKKTVLQNAGNPCNENLFTMYDEQSCNDGYVSVKKYYTKGDTNINLDLLIADERANYLLI